MSQREDDDIEREERNIYAIITMASAPVVIGLAIEGADLDGGGTLSLILVVAGVLGLAAGVRALFARRVPRATIHRER